MMRSKWSIKDCSSLVIFVDWDIRMKISKLKSMMTSLNEIQTSHQLHYGNKFIDFKMTGILKFEKLQPCWFNFALLENQSAISSNWRKRNTLWSKCHIKTVFYLWIKSHNLSKKNWKLIWSQILSMMTFNQSSHILQ